MGIAFKWFAVVHPISPRRKRTTPRAGRSRTGSPVRSPSPSHVRSLLLTFFDRFPSLGRVYSREEPFLPIDPFPIPTSLSLNPFARCYGARTANTRRRRRRRGCDVVSVRHLVYVRVSAVIWLRTLPQHAYIRMRYAPAPILPTCSAAPPFAALFARLAQEAVGLRPEFQRIIDACESIGTDSPHIAIRVPLYRSWSTGSR